jgi:manganese/zinc/iron transport system substrate-binding protein
MVSAFPHLLRMSPRILFAILLLSVVVSCGPVEREIDDGDLRVVTTTTLLADLAREVGGEHVSVESLMGPGVDPHLYRASEGDVARMNDADLILFNGLGLEGRMAEILARLRERAHALAEDIPVEQRLHSPDFEGSFDPHIWMDVALWRDAARALGERFAALDSANADAYRQQASDYADRLSELDEYVRLRTAAIPAGQRVLVTAHDAFGYFGRAYDIDVRGLQGISTATEAGTADVQQLAAFVAQNRIPALFVETSVSPRAIEAVRQAVRARGFDVVIGGDLYSDALGGVGSGAESYEGMIRHNADTIVDALSVTTQ